MGPHPVIPDHALGQGAGVLVAVPAVMLALTYLSVHTVAATKACQKETVYKIAATIYTLPSAMQLQLKCWFRLYAVSVLKKLLGFIVPGSYCSVLIIK